LCLSLLGAGGPAALHRVACDKKIIKKTKKKNFKIKKIPSQAAQQWTPRGRLLGAGGQRNFYSYFYYFYFYFRRRPRGAPRGCLRLAGKDTKNYFKKIILFYFFWVLRA
jgi:hypothetical protein